MNLIRKIVRMQPMIRKILLITTIMLGWINMPAQAFLLSSDQNLWPVMSQKFTIPASAQHRDVRRQIDADLRRPKYIHMLSENAKPYLYTVFQETRKLHLPAELALLPMIESGYHPHGYSKVGAEGLWQLMPSTAADYGIKMNSFYDGRRSTAGSTRAALLFLSYLYQQFDHNWLLALAAYDAGPGTVMEAIKYNQAHGRPTDFWALSLPKETEEYIPKLLALSTIFQHPHAYGMNLARVPNKAVTGTVVIHKEMKLKTIAHLAHTSVYTVKKLNPALRRSVTPPHETVTLVLPVNKKTEFVNHLAAQNTMGRYTVRKGDSLTAIASKFKTTITTLEKINQIHNGMIRINQALIVPRVIPETAKEILSVTKTHKKVATKYVAKKSIVANNTHYIVKRGDDLGKIAHRFHTSRQKIEALNHLNPRAILRVGERLVVEHHVVEHRVATHHSKPITHHTTIAHHDVGLKREHLYIVRRGDDLRKLAREFDTTPYHIMQHNHLRTIDLSIGQHLMLPNA